jgi:tetratricopeptide (TPR) repeat protein
MGRQRVAFVLISLLLFICVTGGLYAQPLPTDQLIQFYQGRIARDPEDFLPYSHLGASYIQKARETGNVTYYDLAERALRQSLTLVANQPAAAPTLTSLAMIALAKHQFHEALTNTQKALSLGSGDQSAYALMGDAYIELGEYDQAARAYEKLRSQNPGVSAHSRSAYLQFLRGDMPAALQSWREAVETARKSNVPAENVAWTQTQYGDILFHTGDLAGAEQAYQAALSSYPGYHPALAHLAKIRAAQQRYQEAIDLYQQALAVIPLPEYVAALGDVYTRLDRPAEAERQYELVEYIGALSALNQVIYNRELALFYADHDRKPQETLQLAKRELEVRRDIYTYDVLAWALHKAEQPQEALAAIQEALKLGTKDARLWFHVGMIHARLGHHEKAIAALRLALSLNPYFHVIQADVAKRTLKQLENQADSIVAEEKKDGQ